MPTLEEFINNNTFTSISDSATRLASTNVILNGALSQAILSDNPEFNNQINKYIQENKYTSGNEFSLGLPGGLSRFDLKAYFNLLDLQLTELKNNPYKIANILIFSTLFHLSNPSWKEGILYNPLVNLAGFPGLGEFIPHTLDIIGSPGHQVLARERDDLKKDFQTYSMLGKNVVHGLFDSPVRVVPSQMPPIQLGQDLAESAQHPKGVSISDIADTLNENNYDFPYPSYAPISQDKEKIDYESLYSKRESLVSASLSVKDAARKLQKDYSLIRKPWYSDLQTSPEYDIIESKEIKSIKDKLYLPLFLTDLRTQRTIILRPYIRRITHDFVPNWIVTEYFNRVDPITQLKNTKRNLSLDFMFVADNETQIDFIKNKTRFLENLVYPMYDPNTFQFTASPICRIRIGDLINIDKDELNTFIRKTNSTIDTEILELGCPGIITSLNYDYDNKYLWTISEKNKTLQIFGVTITMLLFHDYLRGIHKETLKSKEISKEIGIKESFEIV